MQNRYHIKEKIIAYGMIVLLMVNLLSGSVKMNVTVAAGETESEITCKVVMKNTATGQEKTVSNSGITVEYTLDNLADVGLHRTIEVDNGDGNYSVLEGKDGALSLETQADINSKTATETFVAEEGKSKKYKITYYVFKEESGSKVQVGESVVKEFRLDKVSPVVSFESTMNEEKSFQDSVTYTPVVNKSDCSIKVRGTRTHLSEEGEVRTDNLEYIITNENPNVVFDKTGNYEIYTWAKDEAGNETESTRHTFSIDKDGPQISITGVESGKHYNQESLKLVFTLKDLNVSDKMECYNVKIQKNGEEQTNLANAVKWEIKKSEHITTGQLSLSEEGSYHIEVTGKDAVDNSDTKSIDFVIDKTAPTANITVSHDNTQNGEPIRKKETVEGQSQEVDVYYLKDDAKLEYNVTELYGEEGEIHIGSEFNGSASEEKTYSMNSNQISITYGDGGKEGKFESYIWAKDAADNYVGKNKENGSLDPAYQCHFVIDRTAPKFTITGPDGNNSFHSIGDTLLFTAEDANHDLDTYKITVTRTDNNGTVTTQTYEGSAGWTVKDALKVQYKLELSEEGNYTVEFTGQDKSGNEGKNEDGNTASASFRVDTTAPSIELSSVQEGGYYSNDVPLSIHIRELNYADAEASITIARKLGEEEEETTTPLILTQLDTAFEQLFTKDGSYTVCINAKDAAGNEAVPAVIHFVIDKTAPVLTITGIGDGEMTRQEVTLNLRAEDYVHNFSKYRVVVTRSDIDGELESESFVYPAEQWTEEGTVASKSLTFSEEGIYKVTFDAVDKAENEATTASITFSIDYTAPVISEVVYSDANGLLGEKYHNIYSNQAILVEFKVKDQTVGVNNQKVYVTVGKPEEKGLFPQIYIAHKAIGNSYYVYVPTDLSVSEFDDTITIWANDKLDNEGNVTSSNIIFNTNKPEIQMDCDTDYTKWTNQSVTFHTTVTDVKAGIKEVVYKINNEKVKTVKFDSLTTSYSYDLTAVDSADKVTGYMVAVEVTNNCGTSNTMQKRVYIDKDKPKVSLFGIQNGTHYGASQTFTTSVQDVSYRQTKTVYVIKRTLDGKTTDISAAVFSSGKYEDSCKRKMIKEGSYKIYAVTTDSAGNRAVSNTLSFVIDKTAPKLSIDGVTEGTMSGSQVDLEFGCVESFFATNRISIDVERTLDGKTVKSQITGFPKTKKKSSLKHSFTEDGTYRVTMSATDKAGNVATTKTISFSVDRTKPVIRFVGTDNYQQWKKPVTVQFTVEESYYAKNRVEIQGTCTDIDGNVSNVELPKMTCSGKVSSLTKVFDKDGIYEFEVISTDEAGNSERGNIHFTIDQTNPEIHNVKQYDGGYYQQFKLADSLEEIFKDLTVVSYRILLNGIEYDGVASIEEEGKYTLEVDVTDELDHITNETVEFIIDHTAPKVIFSGAKDGGEVHDSGVITLALTNAEDEITDVRMNGVHYGADVRSLSYDEYGSYQIEVDCVDKAGNAVTRSLYFVYSNPMTKVILFGGMGILAVSGCMWLWVRNRKDRRRNKT
ncbi:MAG: Ig-like domain repeat protein [Clostridiales bacterium]|nr:Ig-like domain repeat protein [Clostridiales bacterium]